MEKKSGKAYVKRLRLRPYNLNFSRTTLSRHPMARLTRATITTIMRPRTIRRTAARATPRRVPRVPHSVRTLRAVRICQAPVPLRGARTRAKSVNSGGRSEFRSEVRGAGDRNRKRRSVESSTSWPTPARESKCWGPRSDYSCHFRKTNIIAEVHQMTGAASTIEMMDSSRLTSRRNSV